MLRQRTLTPIMTLPRRLVCLALLVCTACGPARDSSPAARGDIGDRGSQVALGAQRISDHADPAIPQDAPLVLFLGDSITAGLHLAANDAFPSVLQARCARDGHPFRLVNAGVSGDTSAGGLARIDWLLQQKPAIVVIELGGNDGLRGQDLVTIEANLRAIITKVQAAGASVLLLGMRLPPSYGAEYSAAFEAIYAHVAADTQVTFVPYFMHDVGGVPDMMLEDGLHPTARGHVVLADNIAEKLTAMLKAQTR